MIKVRKYDNLMDVGVDVNKKGGKKKNRPFVPTPNLYIYSITSLSQVTSHNYRVHFFFI